MHGFFSVIFAGASVIGIILVGLIVLIGIKIAKSGRDPEILERERQDTQRIQEIHQGLARLDDRVEALETLLLDLEKTRRDR
ncbi:hypothetical protein [Desulfovibrio inopinatus]|uniref:hypothetical protein n=1 Tax=Desulfovibrio inopinatus TaxID=102109 RepID=UPI00040F01F8|nr:hypothetical protein [Desulfovibrio inopinatus]